VLRPSPEDSSIAWKPKGGDERRDLPAAAGLFRILTRLLKILVLRWQGLARYQAEGDQLVAPSGSVSSVVAAPEYGAASPRYTAPLAVFTVLRSSAEIELDGTTVVCDYGWRGLCR